MRDTAKAATLQLLNESQLPPKRRQLRMLRPRLDDLPALEVPRGYGLRTYQAGDESAWAQIMESTGGVGKEWTVERVRARMIERETGNVHMVCALESHRGRGLGRLVTLAVLHRLRERGFRCADLTTDDWRLAAIKSYLALGFVPIYLPDPDGLDPHEPRWSAVFSALLGTRRA